ncbi:MAG: histidine kinase [Gemmatimonadetes bacterium]|nr:histidine kinase [Gemmatimonadota bacterium]
MRDDRGRAAPGKGRPAPASGRAAPAPMTTGAEEEMLRARSRHAGAVPDPPVPAVLALDPDLDVGILPPSRIPAREVLATRWVWLSLAGLFACCFVASLSSYTAALAIGVVDAGLWTAVVACAVVLSWFLPLEEERWRWSLPVLVVLGTGLLFLRRVLLLRYLGGTANAADLLHVYSTNLMLFLSAAGAGYAVFYHFRRADTEQVESRLQAALARANLQLLEMQVDPHFLFNTLNSVAALIERDAEGAVELLRALRRLLARADAATPRQTVPLADEMELMRVYLAVEQRRLGPRLRVVWRVAADAECAEVPRLVLQTLAENAVRHGVAALRRGGTVEIGARRAGARLHAWVEDDGQGLTAARSTRTGLGIAGTRDRLRHLYGADHAFEVRDREGGGVRAWIDIPFVVADDAPEVAA